MRAPQFAELEVIEQFNKALKYTNNGRAEKGLPLFKKLEKSGNGCRELYLNIGTCYKLLDNDEKATEYYLKANDWDVPYSNGSFDKNHMPLALYNLGLLAASHDNNVEAELILREAMRINPGYNLTKMALANVLLKLYSSNKLVDPREAWELYKARFVTEGKPTDLYIDRDAIQWDGNSFVDELVILTEQGLGDYLMFGRFIPYMKQFCNKLYLQCNTRLVKLFPEFNCITNVSETTASHVIPIGSIASLFPGAIPAGDWLRHLNKPKVPNGKLEIGVVWSGSKGHANTRFRNTTPANFRRLSKYATLYTLNPTEHGERGFVPMRGETMYETAMNINKLDLVITIDTSTAHLCGAMGKECWLLLGEKSVDWRWGDASMGSKNIWYDSIRVFRNPGSWNKLFDKVEAELVDRIRS